ncbi:MAG TPA: sulfatase [Actinomycetota bacterium]|nr:sulfatase [Actinomycetota bacterium]
MPRAVDRPNIIVVVFDTARADAFEPHGAPAGSTPMFAQLASSGALHRKAIAPCNWTMPSHVSMFSGLLPRTAGLSMLPHGERANCRIVMEAHRDRWLPVVLGRAGYHTAAATTNAWVSNQIGFDLGFDEFRNLVGKRVNRMADPSLKASFRWYAHAFLARVDNGLSVVERRMNDWISQTPRPFFWFVNLIECHSPYLPPRPYNDLGPLRRLLAGRDARRYQTLEGVWKACATETPPPRPSLERMRRLYDRSIRMMDDWLARLCERLDAAGLLDDTLLVVTSDHGENFGEGHLFGHAVSLDDRLLHVPLVFAGPGAAQAPEGVSSLAALPAYIARAVGLDDHPWSDPDEGIAVAQYDLTPSPDDPRLAMIRQWRPTDEGYRRFAYAGTAATDGRYKLVTLGDAERLYDVEADPHEIAPMRADAGPADVVERLRRALSRSGETEWTPDVEALRAAGPEQPEPSPDEVKELEDRMRLLGYL